MLISGRSVYSLQSLPFARNRLDFFLSALTDFYSLSLVADYKLFVCLLSYLVLNSALLSQLVRLLHVSKLAFVQIKALQIVLSNYRSGIILRPL